MFNISSLRKRSQEARYLYRRSSDRKPQRLETASYFRRDREENSGDVKDHRAQDDIPIEEEDHRCAGQLRLPEQVDLLCEREQVVKDQECCIASQRPSIAERSGTNHPTPRRRYCRRCDCKCISVQVLRKYRRRYIHATQHSYNDGWIQTFRGSHGREPSLSKLTSTREAKSW